MELEKYYKGSVNSEQKHRLALMLIRLYRVFFKGGVDRLGQMDQECSGLQDQYNERCQKCKTLIWNISYKQCYDCNHYYHQKCISSYVDCEIYRCQGCQICYVCYQSTVQQEDNEMIKCKNCFKQFHLNCLSFQSNNNNQSNNSIDICNYLCEQCLNCEMCNKLLDRDQSFRLENKRYCKQCYQIIINKDFCRICRISS